MKNGWSCLGSSCKASHKFYQCYLSSGTCLITLIIAQWPGGKASLWAPSPSGHSWGSSPPCSSPLLLKAINSCRTSSPGDKNHKQWLFDIVKWITPSTVLQRKGRFLKDQRDVSEMCAVYEAPQSQGGSVWISVKPRATMKVWSLCQWWDEIIKGKRKGKRKNTPRSSVMQFFHSAMIISVQNDKSIDPTYNSIHDRGMNWKL